MATYAIGDIQGCWDSLQTLLERIAFNPWRDRLWLLGDLVNRGPKSLAVLRWAMQLGDRAVTVLGNHDLRLLACAAGASKPKKRDTLSEILDAPDRRELMEWLRHRPLAYAEDGYLAVHAGLHPDWTAAQAIELAGEVSEVLRAKDWWARLDSLYGSNPPPWDSRLRGLPRLRAVVNVLVRVRTVYADGRLNNDFSDHPDYAPDGCQPWFEHPEAKWRDHRVLFGHWAALGHTAGPHHISLDTGCVWGNKLSALRLDDRALYQVDAVESSKVNRRTKKRHATFW